MHDQSITAESRPAGLPDGPVVRLARRTATAAYVGATVIVLLLSVVAVGASVVAVCGALAPYMA